MKPLPRSRAGIESAGPISIAAPAVAGEEVQAAERERTTDDRGCDVRLVTLAQVGAEAGPSLGGHGAELLRVDARQRGSCMCEHAVARELERQDVVGDERCATSNEMAGNGALSGSGETGETKRSAVHGDGAGVEELPPDGERQQRGRTWAKRRRSQRHAADFRQRTAHIRAVAAHDVASVARRPDAEARVVMAFDDHHRTPVRECPGSRAWSHHCRASSA